MRLQSKPPRKLPTQVIDIKPQKHKEKKIIQFGQIFSNNNSKQTSIEKKSEYETPSQKKKKKKAKYLQKLSLLTVKKPG